MAKKKMKRKKAEVVADKVVEVLANVGKEAIVCGSLRRGLAEVQDVDVVVVSSLDSAVFELSSVDGVEVLTNLEKATKTATLMVDGVQVDLYSAYKDAVGAMTMFLTGSKLFNIVLRGKAKKQGMKLNQYGLWHGETLIAAQTEEMIFMALGMDYVEPKNRSLEGRPIAEMRI